MEEMLAAAAMLEQAGFAGAPAQDNSSTYVRSEKTQFQKNTLRDAFARNPNPDNAASCSVLHPIQVKCQRNHCIWCRSQNHRMFSVNRRKVSHITGQGSIEIRIRIAFVL